MAKKLIPFKWLPGSWGLAGKTFEKAKAEYELEGDELRLKLSEIDKGADHVDTAKLKLQIDLENKKIDQYTYDLEIINLTLNGKEKELAVNEINLKHHKIAQLEYDKVNCTLKNEPWVAVIKINMDPKKPTKVGEVELDWNDKFLEDLKAQGYNGPTDYFIIDTWFTTLCAAVANENGLIDSTESVMGNKDSGLDGLKEYF